MKNCRDIYVQIIMLMQFNLYIFLIERKKRHIEVQILKFHVSIYHIRVGMIYLWQLVSSVALSQHNIPLNVMIFTTFINTSIIRLHTSYAL